MKEDHRSYRWNFFSCEKKAWIFFRPVRNSNPWPLRYQCSALPIKLTSELGAGHELVRIILNPWKDDDEVMNIWKPYMWTAWWRIIWKKIIAVRDATLTVAKRKPTKPDYRYRIIVGVTPCSVIPCVISSLDLNLAIHLFIYPSLFPYTVFIDFLSFFRDSVKTGNIVWTPCQTTSQWTGRPGCDTWSVEDVWMPWTDSERTWKETGE